MKKGLFFVCLVTLIFGSFFSNIAAQETSEGMFSFGQVVAIADQQLTIKEYNFETDADENIVYEVTSATEYGNVTSLDDLFEFDSVVIDYIEKDGKKRITTLVKEEAGLDTESFEDITSFADEFIEE